MSAARAKIQAASSVTARRRSDSAMALMLTSSSSATSPRFLALLRLVVALLIGSTLVGAASCTHAAITDPEVKKTISGGLDWLAYQQHKLGHWTAQGRY